MINISYSGLKTFNSCPHKFMIKDYANNSTAVAREESLAASVGKAMHEAVQNYFTYKDPDRAMFALIMHYPYDLFLLDQWGKRSIEACAIALDELFHFPDLQKYELVTINHKPAVEVSFAINIDNRVSYRGFIDLVLWDVVEKCYVVCDIKTKDEAQFDLATYAFDHQCTGYRFVLEHLFNQPIANMRTLYLVINCNISNPWIELPIFNHSKEREQEWLMDLALFYQIYQLYNKTGHFPRQSNCCIAYKRRCPFFDYCTYDRATLTRVLGEPKVADNKEYDHNITLTGVLADG